MKDYDEGNSKIYMIGALQECPVQDRDDQCCYKPFLHMDLKTVSEMIDYIPVCERVYLVNCCRSCSFRKQCEKGK